MIYDALTNPPLPEWNALSNEERGVLIRAWEFSSCPHACGGDPIHFYDELRRVLIEKEQRIFKETMAFKPPDTSAP